MQEITFSDVEFDCPNCGHKNKYRQHDFKRGENRQLVYCDSESGGCDQQLILTSVVKTSVDLKAYRIPGLKYTKKQDLKRKISNDDDLPW